MLTELFKTEERARVLRYVMFRSALSVAEVSRATGISKGLVSRYLRRLMEHGLLQKEGRRYSPLEVEWPMLFDRIRSVRHADQYSFQAKPTAEEVQAGIDLAERFLDRMERLLRETSAGKP